MHTTNKTLRGHIIHCLREAIVKGEIAPGEKLNEPKLAEQFNVSRGPLREAIHSLVSMRLVTHIPHVGATVTTLDLNHIIELYEVREALEGKAAALAALAISDNNIKKLKELLVLHKEHTQNNDGVHINTEGDFDFHYLIIKNCGNAMLENQLCNELYHLIRMFRYQTSRYNKRSDRALFEHEQLLYAIENRDPEMAEMLMRRHISRAKESIRSVINNTN